MSNFLCFFLNVYFVQGKELYSKYHEQEVEFELVSPDCDYYSKFNITVIIMTVFADLMPLVLTLSDVKSLYHPVTAVLYWEIQVILAHGVEIGAFKMKGVPNDVAELNDYTKMCKENLAKYELDAGFSANDNPFRRVLNVDITVEIKEQLLDGA